MRVLIDAHVLIWYVDQHHLLGTRAHAAITDPANDLLLSAGSVWEIAIKVGLKKLVLNQPFRPWMDKAIADLNVALLQITVEHADTQAGLPDHHRDPFDRLLVAQAQVEAAPLISVDAILDLYGISRIW